MTVIIDTIHGDRDVKQLISVIQAGLSQAVAGDLVTPEFKRNLVAWVNSEKFRMREEPSPTGRDLADPLVWLRQSKWWPFWSTLEPGQEVRWTRTKNATYEVVTGDLVIPEEYYRYSRSSNKTMCVELRRKSGKTFWTPVVLVRPKEWTSSE